MYSSPNMKPGTLKYSRSTEEVTGQLFFVGTDDLLNPTHKMLIFLFRLPDKNYM